jgi:hypothetical protein
MIDSYNNGCAQKNTQSQNSLVEKLQFDGSYKEC